MKNTGPVTGSEVVQVYAGYTGASSDRPNEELCGFAKIELQPGDTGRVDDSGRSARTGMMLRESGPWKLGTMFSLLVHRVLRSMGADDPCSHGF